MSDKMTFGEKSMTVNDDYLDSFGIITDALSRQKS